MQNTFTLPVVGVPPTPAKPHEKMRNVLLFPKLLALLFVGWFNVYTATAAIEPVTSGSFIVNMGVLPQTYGNGVKPWGMLYDLIHNYQVQVKWVIDQNKTRLGKDFTYNGVDYKGGTFIILQQYRTAAVNARISYWQTQGVVGATTSSLFYANVTYTLKYTPRWTFDFQNGKIALGFLLSAGIDTAGQRKKLPSELNGCDDLFVMPHADPTWETHKNLRAWNLNNKGWIWAGCHAVSALESLSNPLNPSEKMNFLSTTGLVLWGNHQGASAPFSFRYPADPEMQMMGNVEQAMRNGSEQVFLPLLGGAWRPTTKLAVYDPTQQDIPSKSNGEAGLIIYGRAYGDSARGKVMYEAGHDINKNNEDAVSALRAFFSFSFMSVYEKEIVPVLSGESIVSPGASYTYSVALPQGFNPANYTYHWTSGCGGTFSNPNANTTTYSPGPSFSNGCQLMVTITDACGRANYQTVTLGDPGRPLAVKLDNFTGSFVNGYGQLNWNTLTENELGLFEIERSTDGVSFNNIGQVMANGNSLQNINYSYVDLLVQKGMNYYRLKQVDRDGKFTYSKVVVINTEFKGISLLLVYPNPFGHKVQVKIESEKREEVTIRVLNNGGVVIRSQNVFVEKGVSAIEVKNVAELPGGVYHLQIITPEKTMSVKIMKQ